MSNSIQLATCCQNGLIAPFGLPQNSFCCNDGLIAPVSPNFNSGGNTPATCLTIDCSSYTPTCFTPQTSYLCGYIAGIDAELCTLKMGLTSLPCSAIQMDGPYPCISPPTIAPIITLCDFANAMENYICGLNSKLIGSQSSSGITGATNNNLVVDGNNGTFSGATGTVGITGTNVAVSSDSTVFHGNSTSSLKALSANPLAPSGTINTTTAINVIAGRVYEVKAYVNPQSSITAGAITAGAITAGVNGTGTQTILSSVTPGGSNANIWLVFSTKYVPDVNQSVTLSLKINTFFGGILNFADLTMMPLTETNSGGNYEYEIPQQKDINAVYKAIASSFAITTNYSTSGLFITVGQDAYIINGKYVIGQPTTLGFTANSTTYVFYDTWTDSYVTSPSNVPASTQMLLYTIVTNGSVVSTKTNNFNTAPFNGTSIQAATITGGQIANSTVQSANLANTAVTATTYGDTTHVGQFVVNAQGQITGASSLAIAFPVTSVNGLTGGVSLGLGNLSNVILTTPSNGQFLKYNGTNWVNASITANYYQTVLSNLSPLAQQPGLNFATYFALTNDVVNSVTTVSIAAASLTYDRIQNTAGTNVLLGNSSGSIQGITEQTVSTDLLLSGGALSVNYVINKQNIASYPSVIADFTGTTIIECQYPSTGAMAVVLPVANSVAVGRPLRIKDISGAANTHNITISVTGGANIDGATTLVISTAYGKAIVYSDGTNYYTA